MAVKYSSYSLIKRLLALCLLIVFFACLILFRLFYLQILNGYSLIQKGLTEWLRDLPLIANRGTITDRNGVVLASSYTTYDVYVRPADVEDAEAISSVLASALELEYDEVYAKVTKSNYSEVLIESDIDKETVQTILANFQSGIFFTTDTERNYTYDSLLCQILGFVGSDNDGQSGLEAFYNTYLAGIDGVSLVESDLTGSTLDSSITYYEDAVDGLNLTLTIDFSLQYAVEQIVAEAMGTTGAKSISVMITNPKTGEILSSVTLPSYDLNNVPRDDGETLNSLSRAVSITDTYEPGSTFKILVAAIALEEGITTRHDYFYCAGYRIINGVRIKCARRSGHGSQTLEQGLMNSCNCVFMDLIQKIGVVKFYEYLEKFGFTSTYGIDFPGETTAVLMSQASVTAPDLARMGFGQSIAVSTLEMVVGIGSVINGGLVVQPHFLSSITTEAGETIYERTTTVLNQVISEETSQTMREMLLSVVEKGGGKNAKVDGYPIIGGKTGTAQKYENGQIAQGKYIASFVGFAPYDDPEYLVYVMVDEPQGSYYGGVVAAPIAKSIFEYIFSSSSYQKDESDVSEANIELPTFIGMTLTEAATKIAELGLQYLVQGDGDYVTGQISAPGTMVSENDIVLLIFE